MFVPIPVVGAAVALILLLLALLLRRGSSAPDVIVSRRALVLPGELEVRVRELLASGDKIEAIKMVRTSTGAGLKESKELVDRMGGQP